MFLMVGLPGAGKTARAKELATRHGALRLSPDAWMIPLFGDSDAGGKRDVLEGQAEADRWRAQFEAPDSAELAGTTQPGPPPGWPGWSDWAADRWPSQADG